MAQKLTTEKLTIPEGVNFQVEGPSLKAKGKHGEVQRKIDDPLITVKIEGVHCQIIAEGDSKREGRKVGTWKAHILNMCKGAMFGHHYKLKVCSGHFPMNVTVSDKEVIVKNFLGEKVPRKLTLKTGAKVKLEGDHITIESSSKELAGQIAADIEKLTAITGRDLRKFQDGIWIVEKDGKAIK